MVMQIKLIAVVVNKQLRGRPLHPQSKFPCEPVDFNSWFDPKYLKIDKSVLIDSNVHYVWYMKGSTFELGLTLLTDIFC